MSASIRYPEAGTQPCRPRCAQLRAPAHRPEFIVCQPFFHRLSPSPRRSRCRLTMACAMTGRMPRSEEHTSELHSLMRISYAVFCLKKKTEEKTSPNPQHIQTPDRNCN